MNKRNTINILIIAGVFLLAAGVAAVKSARQEKPAAEQTAKIADVSNEQKPETPPNVPLNYAAPEVPKAARLPSLIEVGGEKCIPCIQMAPIIEELRKEYEGRVDIQKIDLGKTPSAQKIYSIRLIPTQVFLNADGSEFWRNEGTLTKEQILAKFIEMGIK